MLKGFPANCVPIFPPEADSTKKLFNVFGLILNVLLLPVFPPAFVDVRVKAPVFDILTLCEGKTPAVNAAVVPLPVSSVPVELMVAVPV